MDLINIPERSNALTERESRGQTADDGYSPVSLEMERNVISPLPGEIQIKLAG